MTRKTLAEFNATAREWDWSEVYRLRDEYAVGYAGVRRTGTKLHVIRVERIVAELREHKPGTCRPGQVFSSAAACGSRNNGQRTAWLTKYDTAQVTCERCIERFGWRE